MFKHNPETHEDCTLMRSTPLPLARWLRADVFILLAIFAVFYFFRLASFSPSIDDEVEALRPDKNVWILTGRWAGYLFQRFVAPQAVIPFFSIFFFGACLSVSYPILLSAFGIKRTELAHYLVFPFYVAFPTWVFLAAFATNIDSAAFGQLLIVCALYAYSNCIQILQQENGARKRRLIRHVSLAIVLFSFALGLYQSFLLAFVALGFGVQLVMLRTESSALTTVLTRFIVFVAIVVGGGVTYSIINAVFRASLHLQDTAYLSAFFDWHTLMSSPLVVAGKTLHSIANVYGGQSEFYGAGAFAFPAILGAGFVALVAAPRLSLQRRLALAAAALAVLCVPFAQHLFAGGLMPSRTLVAVPVIFWLFALVGVTSQFRGLALFSFASIILGLLQIIYSSNLLLTANQFARIHDAQLSAALYARIAQANPDFDAAKPYLVDFFGGKPFVTEYPRPFSSTVGFSFFEWDGGNETRILGYMQLIGYTNIRAPSHEQRQRDLAYFQQMPVWPARDSVRVVGEITLVKLGASPGVPFNVQ